MKKVLQDELFVRIETDLSLLNSRLTSLRVDYIENSLKASLSLMLTYANCDKLLTLAFDNVQEYSFSYKANFSFYNVESYKFIQMKEGIFLSLDPADDYFHRSLEDQDYIFAKNVYALL